MSGFDAARFAELFPVDGVGRLAAALVVDDDGAARAQALESCLTHRRLCGGSGWITRQSGGIMRNDYVEARRHAAELAERHALAVLDGNLEALDAMRQYGHERDTWDQQIAWLNRRTGAAWPVEPAWCD